MADKNPTFDHLHHSNTRSTHQQIGTDGSITNLDIQNNLLSLSFSQMSLLSEVKRLSQVLLVM